VSSYLFCYHLELAAIPASARDVIFKSKKCREGKFLLPGVIGFNKMAVSRPGPYPAGPFGCSRFPALNGRWDRLVFHSASDPAFENHRPAG
jgi:hypothetical protein